jgi:hypothetical protein
MIYGVKSVAKRLLGIDKANRDLAVYPDDTFLVSYPRSGNTWTRFLIANLVHPDQGVNFTNIEDLFPDAALRSNRDLKRTPRPRIIKTHQYFDHRYPKVIYVVRDPRDVVLSYYDFHRRYRQIEDTYPLERYIDDFVSGRLLSACWGTWAENVASWIFARQHCRNFLLLRYEDMHTNALREIARVAQFLEIEPDPTLLRRAVELSSAKCMRELEQTASEAWAGNRNCRKDIPFIRTARIGGWRSAPQDCIRRIEDAWGELMTTLGYEPLFSNQTTSEMDRHASAMVPVPHASSVSQRLWNLEPAVLGD